LGTMTSTVMRYSESSTKSSLLTISLNVRVKRLPLEGRGTHSVTGMLTPHSCNTWDGGRTVPGRWGQGGGESHT
jgi:hypothetical protein